jgi:hypothetical protein
MLEIENKAIDHTLWETCCCRDSGPLERQTTGPIKEGSLCCLIALFEPLCKTSYKYSHYSSCPATLLQFQDEMDVIF